MTTAPSSASPPIWPRRCSVRRRACPSAAIPWCAACCPTARLHAPQIAAPPGTISASRVWKALTVVLPEAISGKIRQKTWKRSGTTEISTDRSLKFVVISTERSRIIPTVQPRAARSGCLRRQNPVSWTATTSPASKSAAKSAANAPMTIAAATIATRAALRAVLPRRSTTDEYRAIPVC